LDGIASGAEVNVATNLGLTASDSAYRSYWVYGFHIKP